MSVLIFGEDGQPHGSGYAYYLWRELMLLEPETNLERFADWATKKRWLLAPDFWKFMRWASNIQTKAWKDRKPPQRNTEEGAG